MARVTLQTIADEVGVSRMTVSNAFSRPDQLSRTLRTTILATATRMGYVGPDPSARALARGTTGAVGVLLTSSLRSAFFDDVATGFLAAVAAEVEPTGMALTLLASTVVNDVIPARDVAMDGALVYSCEADMDAAEWLLRRGLPVVFVDQQPTEGLTCVNVDDRGGARAAAQLLVDLGHSRVAVFTAALVPGGGFVDDPVSDAMTCKHVVRERLLGYVEVLSAAGITPVVHRQQTNSDIEAFDAALDLLAREDRPTGVLCFSDVLASGVLGAAESLGLSVPGDLSVIGFDDAPLARRLRPQLTTVRQDVARKGQLSASELRRTMDAARAGTTAEARHTELPTELVVRDTTSAPPG